MSRFEKVGKYEEVTIPTRATENSAGYDLSAAEDTVVPSLLRLAEHVEPGFDTLGLETVEKILKALRFRPVLVPTGVKVQLAPNEFLSLSARSSLPLKSMLLVANAPGIIDSDYYNNPDNEGEIFIQLVNLSPFDILVKKGDRIAQGVIMKYGITDDDTSTLKRVSGHGSTGGR